MARDFEGLQDAVIRKDFESSSTDYSTAIKEWLNEAYMEISKKDLRCFLTSGTISIVSGTWEYAVSGLTNFRKMKKVILNEVGEIDIKNFDNPKYLYYEKADADRDTGDPTTMWRNLANFEFNPIPDATRTATCWYYQIPDFLVADAASHLIPDNYENLMIDFAKAVYDDREKDWPSVDRKMATFYSKLNQWVDDEFEEEEEQKDIEDLEYEYKKEGRLSR